MQRFGCWSIGDHDSLLRGIGVQTEGAIGKLSLWLVSRKTRVKDIEQNGRERYAENPFQGLRHRAGLRSRPFMSIPRAEWIDVR